jgi:Predicted oxidoreductases of the aldo/keto reductase family
MDKNDKSSRGIGGRRLLQAAGAGVAGGAVLYGLDKLRLLPSFEQPKPVPPAERMTCRVNPKNGDKVSLLGFGCMRFPMLPGADSPTGPGSERAGGLCPLWTTPLPTG